LGNLKPGKNAMLDTKIGKPAKAKININDISRDERKLIARNVYAKQSYFQKQYQHDEFSISCPEQTQKLRHEFERLLLEKGIVDKPVALESLHEFISPEMRGYDFAHGVNKVSTYFYQTDDQFTNAYHDLIKFLRNNVVNESFWLQATPTIRVHCPNAENADLYPRYHSDICYGHPPEEINIWIPLTEKRTGHGFSMMGVKESKEILEQFDYDYPDFIEKATYDREFSKYCESVAHPVDTEYGSVFLFDSRCIHSGEPLRDHTRISIDIRVLPLSEYQNMEIEHQGSGRLKILFEPNHCYNSMESDKLLNM
jgi:hypothetical protein